MPTLDSSNTWSAFIETNPDSHLLQTSEWGELKASFGWVARSVVEGDRGAQVLFRKLPLGLTLAYIPMGPIGNWLPDLSPALDELCRSQGAFMLKVEPDQPWDDVLAHRLVEAGFQRSKQTIQPSRTIIVDLQSEQEAVLKRMKQKTRYNIRLAERKGVTVHPSDDIAAFAGMTQETAARDAFGAHNQVYFQKAYELFHPGGKCELLVALVEGQPVAALMVFAQGKRSWYLYGASRDMHREKMPAYLLQWHAMRWAQAKGCSTYDMWGIPDHDETTLEAQFSSRSDGLWGVYRFKRGFGGQVTRTMGAWDRLYNPPLYRLYKLAARLRGFGGS